MLTVTRQLMTASTRTRLMPSVSRAAAVMDGTRTLLMNEQQRRWRSQGPTSNTSNSVFHKFYESIRKQYSENKELQQNLKELQKESEKIAEVAPIKAARQILGAAQKVSQQALPFTSSGRKASKKPKTKPLLIKENVIEEQQGPTIVDQLESNPHVGHFIKAGRHIKRKLVDENRIRYGGISRKDRRAQIRAERAERLQDPKNQPVIVEEDVNAGSNVVLHKDSVWAESWKKLKDSNPVIQGFFTMKRRIEESDNIIVTMSRKVTDMVKGTFGTVFAENETAKALREISNIDPTFNLDSFLREMHEYIIPEVLDAYIQNDDKLLKEWCSDMAYMMLTINRENMKKNGLVNSSKILDLRKVELLFAKMLEDKPVLVVSFMTQEMVIIKNAKGEIVEGTTDKIENVFYVWALTKERNSTNVNTGGWKVVEISLAGSSPTY